MCYWARDGLAFCAVNLFVNSVRSVAWQMLVLYSGLVWDSIVDVDVRQLTTGRGSKRDNGSARSNLEHVGRFLPEDNDRRSLQCRTGTFQAPASHLAHHLRCLGKFTQYFDDRCSSSWITLHTDDLIAVISYEIDFYYEIDNSEWGNGQANPELPPVFWDKARTQTQLVIDTKMFL